MNINHVALSGNLTRDPELGATPSGTPVLKFGIAVNDVRPNRETGGYDRYANFFECVTFGHRAESILPFLHKGGKVTVEGKLRWASWEKDGQRRQKVEVWVDNIDLPPKPRDDGAPVQPAPQAATPAQPEYDAYGEDIPF